MNLSRGFTLIELMIVAAGLGGLALVVMNLNKTTQKSSVKFQVDTEINLITNEIVASLSSPAVCNSLFAGKNALSTPNATTNVNNRYFVLTDAQAPAAGYGNGQVKINNYDLSSTAAQLTNNVAYLNIIYKNRNLLSAAAGNSTISKRVNLYVEVDGSNVITNCRSLSSSSADIWSRGNGSVIHYSGGNVGINTDTPSSALDINGELKISNSNLACDLSTEGSIRYNNVSHAVEYCGAEGSPLVYSWTKMGGGFTRIVQLAGTGNFIVPAASIKVIVVGGGGAGGGSQGAYGGGGASGSTCIKHIRGLTVGSTISYRVGRGAQPNQFGESSNFGPHCTAYSGGNGTGPNYATGGWGNEAIGGDINIYGSLGGDATLGASGAVRRGYGAQSHLGNFGKGGDGGGMGGGEHGTPGSDGVIFVEY